MKPIAFMRLRRADTLESVLLHYGARNLIVEQKYDGFKILASTDRESVRLYSRNGNDLTPKAPKISKILARLLPKDTSVLGELIYNIDGHQSIGSVQSILHSSDPRIAQQKSESLGGRLEFIIYDCLEHRGEIIAHKPWKTRRIVLESIIPARGVVRRSKTYPWTKRNEAMFDSIQSGGEGIVVKVINSSYVYGKSGSSEPYGQWWKYKIPGKKSHNEDVILFGYEKRKKRIAFKMHQIDQDGKRIFVGHISNLPRDIEKLVQRMSDQNIEAVAEISHQERFPSGKFRHPGWIRLRPDKPVKSVTMMRARKSNKMTRQLKPSREFQSAIDSHFGRSKKRISNPRNSKVKDALSSEATRFVEFEDFAKAYWDACSRGIYWHATDDKNFYIGDYERKLIESGSFHVHCSPELALSGKNEKKKYVAELDVTRVPNDSIRIKRGSAGSEIKIVGSPGSVKVSRVLDADAAQRSFQWQLSLLPSSKEGLRKVWEKAWEKRKREDAIRGVRLRKEKEREEKRSRAKRMKEDVAAARRERKEEATLERRKKARELLGRRARASAEAKKREGSAPPLALKEAPRTSSGKKSPKKKAKSVTGKKKSSKKKKGHWKRVPLPPASAEGSHERISNPSSARKILFRINNPGF